MENNDGQWDSENDNELMSDLESELISDCEEIIIISSDEEEHTPKEDDLKILPQGGNTELDEDSINDQDADLDPAFIVYDDSDDEYTISKEELMAPIMEPEEELKILAEDLNMTSEELKLQCNLGRSKRKREKVDYKEMDLNDQMVKRKSEPKSLLELSSRAVASLDSARPSCSSDYSQPDTTSGDNRPQGCSQLTLFYLSKVLSDSISSEEDADFKPLTITKKKPRIRIGPNYQAVVVPVLIQLGEDYNGPESSRGDELMWNPVCPLSDEQFTDYLLQTNNMVHSICRRYRDIPANHNPDSEQALKILLNADFNVDIALRMFSNNVYNIIFTMYGHRLNRRNRPELENPNTDDDDDNDDDDDDNDDDDNDNDNDSYNDDDDDDDDGKGNKDIEPAPQKPNQ